MKELFYLDSIKYLFTNFQRKIHKFKMATGNEQVKRKVALITGITGQVIYVHFNIFLRLRFSYTNICFKKSDHQSKKKFMGN